MLNGISRHNSRNTVNGKTETFTKCHQTTPLQVIARLQAITRRCIFTDPPLRHTSRQPFLPTAAGDKHLSPKKNESTNSPADLTIRGDVLIGNGWTYEMIDKLEPFIPHPWRKRRKFLLAELKKVSETLYVGKTENRVSKTPSVRKPGNKVPPARRVTQYDFV